MFFDTTGYDGGQRDGSTIIGHVDKDGSSEAMALSLDLLIVIWRPSPRTIKKGASSTSKRPLFTEGN